MSFLAGSFALTGCDPVQEEVDNNTVQSSAEDILSGITFTQYSDAEYTTPAADGNYIFYQTTPGRQVQIFNNRSDGTMNLLASGASGKFAIKPSRGSDSKQSFYIRALNSDGSVTTAETALNVFVQQELDPEIRFLASDAYGSKTWTWDASINDDGAVWGNMGYCGGKGSDVGTVGNGKWWGVTSTEDFNGQLQHSEGGVNHGDGDMNAYMVISDEGVITSYDAQGNVIRSGGYAVENYDPAGEWKVGDLRTDAILWPWVINTDAKLPSQVGWGTGAYEIVYLTSDKLTLVYPGADDASGGLGSWSEATYWHFKSSSDLLGMAMGYEKSGKSWTWDNSVNDDGAVWGNMGYCGGSGADVGTFGNGKWWGVTSTEDFNGQLQHSEGGVNHGDGDMDAYMTLTPDGLINSYAADGTVIRTGTFELTPVEDNEWKVAELKTDAILWPWVINTDATLPSQVGWGNGAYEVVYLTGDKMTLVYPGADAASGGLGSWSEATYWHFKAK